MDGWTCALMIVIAFLFGFTLAMFMTLPRD
jgi:hypothetical protein